MLCLCVCDTEDVQLTPALLSLVGNLRGSPGPKGISVDGALFLHLDPSFLGVGSGAGLENFFSPKLKDEQWKDLIESVGRAENWLYRQNILEWEGS